MGQDAGRLRAGVHPKVVSERLGHSSVAFTLDTYAHVMPGMQPEAAELFASMVGGSRTPTTSPRTRPELHQPRPELPPSTPPTDDR